MEPILVIMAAGMGSRYGGLKQVDPVGPHGQAIIDYSLYDAHRAGFRRVVFVISEAMAGTFPAEIRARVGDVMDICCAVQRLDDVPDGFGVPEGRERPWGTGHAVRACRGLIDAPFAVINADDYYGPRALALIHGFLMERKGQSGRYAMVGYRLINTLSKTGHVSRGICRTDGHARLCGIEEVTHIIDSADGPLRLDADGAYRLLDADSVASMNLWGFTPDFALEVDARFARFLQARTAETLQKAEYFLPEVVGEMIDEGAATVDVLQSPERWYGVTYREDRPEVERAMREMVRGGLYPARLWQGGRAGVW